MNQMKILWKTITPVAVLVPIIATCVSCNHNVYAKNKDDLLRLIDACKNESKALLWKYQNKIFHCNVDSPFINYTKVLTNNDRYQYYENYKARDLLDKEKWELIVHNWFSNVKQSIYKLDIDHKQQYETILLLKHQILNLKGQILSTIENWVLSIK